MTGQVPFNPAVDPRDHRFYAHIFEGITRAGIDNDNIVFLITREREIIARSIYQTLMDAGLEYRWPDRLQEAGDAAEQQAVNEAGGDCPCLQ